MPNWSAVQPQVMEAWRQFPSVRHFQSGIFEVIPFASKGPRLWISVALFFLQHESIRICAALFPQSGSCYRIRRQKGAASSRGWPHLIGDPTQMSATPKPKSAESRLLRIQHIRAETALKRLQQEHQLITKAITAIERFRELRTRSCPASLKIFAQPCD